MSKIRSKNTNPEKRLFTELKALDIKYSKYRKMYGKPDISFPNEKVAVFVDGDFWHGYNWKVKKKIPPKGYWQNKIKKNILRDRKVNSKLSELGWKVIRIWEHDIREDTSACVAKIVKAINHNN
jgi:DNA mismatch endonuclease (patch repair protein)